MAAGGQNTESTPRPIVQASHRGAPAVNNVQTATSPPSKRELTSWWKKFRKTTEKQEDNSESAPGIFGVPLAESIRYANVAISLTNEQGESFIYGYVPIVVAKCGVFLKEKATDVEGIFRLSGSAKRIKDLQVTFNSPDRYGKGLDWAGYTVHDAANILRRYLNQLPEPIVPLNYYERFRDPLRDLQAHYDASTEDQRGTDNFNHDAAVAAYQRLITELPPLNRQLLLYILDLLAVFSSKSDLNRMNAANLAAIFQPGIISHPAHDMSPKEYKLSQEVLIFLIENQDNFLIGMSGTAVDEKTLKDVESGVPAARSPKSTIGRSASNASAGADSMRKFGGGVRRNVSVSSHGSRDRPSPGAPSPGTPSTPTGFAPGAIPGSGLARSNTVPSKRSPAIGSHRFQRVTDSGGSSPHITNHTAVTDTPPLSSYDSRPAKIDSNPSPPTQQDEHLNTLDQSVATAGPVKGSPDVLAGPNQESEPVTSGNLAVSSSTVEPPAASVGQQTSPKDRKLPALFARSPIFSAADSPSGPQRPTKKLQKKPRMPGAVNESAQSSSQSLHADDTDFHTPMMSPELASNSRADPMATYPPAVTNTIATPVGEAVGAHQGSTFSGGLGEDQQRSGLKPPRSPAVSAHSRSSMTDPSDFDALDDTARTEKPDRVRNRWRLSSSAKKADQAPLAPPPTIGQLPGARGSNSSIGSSGPPRKSFTGDSQMTSHSFLEASNTTHASSVKLQSSNDSSDMPPQSTGDGEPEKRGGLFGRFRAKISQNREERDAKKDRAKSPPRGEHNRSSLSAMAQEVFAPRTRSFEGKREHHDVLPTVTERPSSRHTSAPTNVVVPMRQSSRQSSPTTHPPPTVMSITSTSEQNISNNTAVNNVEPIKEQQQASKAEGQYVQGTNMSGNDKQ